MHDNEVLIALLTRYTHIMLITTLKIYSAGNVFIMWKTQVLAN